MDKRTILIVDDDLWLRQIVDFKLRFMHFNTEIIASIKDAADYIRGNRRAIDGGNTCEIWDYPDLVILDLHFDGERLNGFDFLRMVRENPETTTLPVIILSAYGDDEKVLRSRQLGANAFVTKPFSINALANQIQEILGVNP